MSEQSDRPGGPLAPAGRTQSGNIALTAPEGIPAAVLLPWGCASYKTLTKVDTLLR